MHSFAKINSKQWNVEAARMPNCGADVSNDEYMSESKIVIQAGELLAGVLDKQQYGATTYGLIHAMYEIYGGEVSTRLLTSFTKVFTYFLQWEGFTLGVKDILVTAAADKKRHKIITESRRAGVLATAAALDLDADVPLDTMANKMSEAYLKDPKFRVILDRKYKSLLDNFTNNINKTCLPLGLISKFPQNNLQLMVLSGAKGSMVNTMQISCLLGQIELEGKRPPLMISGKSLPSFTEFEMSPKSGGFIDGRFMTGIQPQDFFFHCMAGREGLIDTAVKTSRSGYLQRCLVKHLEGLTVGYDLTVRDSDNSVVQFLYGEDGLDILKSTYFNRFSEIKFLARNAPAILKKPEMQDIKDEDFVHLAMRHGRDIKSWKKKQQKRQKKENFSSHCAVRAPFTNFSAELINEIEVRNPKKLNSETGRRSVDESMQKLWHKSDAESKALYRKKYAACPDPITSLYRPDTHFGAISEKMQQMLDDLHIDDEQSKKLAADVLHLKSIKALADPGDPVGLLAAQSIGEPSTQMTLNTFHFAGRGEMNVTLGIPRLREILMMASDKIKTPSMDIPIKLGMERKAEKLRIDLNRVTVADILHDVRVKVRLMTDPSISYRYELHFRFLPREVYADDFCVRPKRMIKYMGDKFFKELFRAIIKSGRKRKTAVEITEKGEKNNKDDDDDAIDNDADNNESTRKSTKKTSNGDGDADSSDDEQEDEDDATGIKLKMRKQDENDYDEPDDVEEMQDANEEEAEDKDEENEEIVADENGDDADDQLADDIKDKVLNNQLVNDYVYDKEHYLWCKLSFDLNVTQHKPNIGQIIRDVAAKSVVHEVQNIKRAIIYKGDNDKPLLKTDGLNIVEMFKHNAILEVNKLYSNDIHAIARTYGIEAATQVIMKEVTNVFKVYGITVNRRHLSLIADYMTFDGTFKPLSRKGIEHSASPFQQMSFESCMQFLKTATGSGRSDELNSPSARLMVGAPVRNGTGAFELRTKIC